MKSICRAGLAAAFAVLGATSAFAAPQNEGLYGIQITNGTADLYDGSGAAKGYITAYDHSELGLALQYWRVMRADYAFNFTIGTGWFSETDQPGNNASPRSSNVKYTQTSWSLRVGGDRVVKVGDRAAFYFGPGLEYWTGKAKYEAAGTGTSWDSQYVSRYGLSGRVGGVMYLSDKLGFNCQVGRYVSYATVTDEGAKASWWPSGFQAAGGLVLRGR